MGKNLRVRPVQSHERKWRWAVFVVLAMVTWTMNAGFDPFPPGKMSEKDVILEVKEDLAAGSYETKVLWTFYGICGFFFLIRNLPRTIFLLKTALPLLILLSICAISVLWSPVSDIAVRRVIRLIFMTTLAAGIVVGFETPRSLHKSLVLFTGLIMMINVLSILLLPDRATQGGTTLIGLHIDKNAAGFFAMFSVLVWASYFYYDSSNVNKIFILSGVLIWFLFLIGTYSKTPLAVTFIVLLIAFTYNRFSNVLKYNNNVIFLFFGLTLFFSFIYLSLYLNILTEEFLLSLPIATLLGRIEIWDWVLKVYFQNPVGGIGYGSLWTTGDITPAFQYARGPLTAFLLRINQAHNGYIDILATLGTIGALGLIYFIAHIGSLFLRLPIQKFGANRLGSYVFCFYIILGVLIHNLSESSILRYGSFYWFVFLIAYFLLCRLYAEYILGKSKIQ